MKGLQIENKSLTFDKMKFTQQVDKYALLYIINNYASLYPQKDMTVRTGELTMLRRFYASLDADGRVEIEYKYTNKDYKRQYGTQINITTLPRIVRHTIARNYNIDIDIKNCHPTLLLAYCEKNSIPCQNLRHYVENRTEILDLAPGMKTELISIINGGKPRISIINGGKPSFLNKFICAFSNEIKDIMKRVQEIEGRNGRIFVSNKEGKLLNRVMIDLENKALMAMVKFFRSEDMEITSLAFDGLTLRSDQPKIANLNKLLIACSQAVFEAIGAELIIVQKAMDEGIELPRGYDNTPMVLPPRFVPQTVASITHKIDGYLDQKEYDNIIREHDFIFDTRSTGSGKSVNMMRYLESLASAVIVHHRISLDEDNVSKYSFISSYKDGSAGQKVSVVVNSLHKTLAERFGGDIHNVAGFFVDEIRSVLRQTNMKDMEVDILDLFNIFRYHSAPIVMLDANQMDADIEFIRTFRPDARIAVIGDKSRDPEFEIDVHMGDEGDLIVFLIDHFRQPDACGVVLPYSCDKTKINAYIELVNEQLPEPVSWLNINRETRKEIDMSPANLAKYRIIGFSPTISEGFSVKSAALEGRIAVALFNNSTALPETCSQMMRRFRDVKTMTAFIQIAVDLPARFSDTERYFEYASKNIEYLSRHVVNKALKYDEELKVDQFKIVRDDFWRLHATVEVENELQRANFCEVFMQKLVNNKFTVHDHTLGEQKDSDTEDEKEMIAPDADHHYEVVKKHISQRYIEMNAEPTLLRETYEKLKSNMTTRSEFLQAEKYWICNAVGIAQSSPETLEYFGEHRDMIAGVRRLRRLVEFRPEHTFAVGSEIPDLCDVNVSDEMEEKIERATSDMIVAETGYRRVMRLNDCDGFLDQRREGLLRMSAPYDHEMLKILQLLGWAEIADLRALPALDFDAAKEYLTYWKYRSIMQLNWRRPISQVEYDKKIQKNVSYTSGVLNKLLGVIGIEIVVYQKQYWQVCCSEHMRLTGSPSHGSITNALVDEATCQKWYKMFFWAKERSPCPHCELCGPNYAMEEHILRRHSGAKLTKKKVSYQCEKCGKDCKGRLADYNRHIASCGVVKEKKEKTIHRCERCPYSTTHKGTFKRHLERCKK